MHPNTHQGVKYVLNSICTRNKYSHNSNVFQQQQITIIFPLYTQVCRKSSTIPNECVHKNDLVRGILRDTCILDDLTHPI